MSERERILVVRRDNIGDLVLTTPLIRALRILRPRAWIAALVNSYNAPVLGGNPDLDAVFAYDKAKHRPDRIRGAVLFETARLLLSLRRRRIDHVILAGPGAQRQAYALVRWLRPRALTGFVTPGFAPAGITVPIAYGDGAHLHETEDVFRLLAPFGSVGVIPPCSVHADAARVADLIGRVAVAPASPTASGGPLIAVHVSARRAKQRWPVPHVAATLRELHARHGARFLLLWSPGAADDVRHPGDDAKAAQVLAALPGAFPVSPCPTLDLADLIAALSLADAVICPDGGAMHLAAGLGKPVIALFGDSPPARWRPWGVPYEVVQGPQGDVGGITPAAVLAAWERLAPRVSG